MSLQFTRRAVSAAFGLALVLGAVAQPVGAQAQAFPSRPIHLVVTGAAGSSTDLIARRLAKLIQEKAGATVVVENQGGASGSIALTSTMNSPPDGYRLVIAVPDSVTIYPLLKKARPYNAEKNLTPIAQVAEAHFAFVVNAKNPAGNMAEFVQAVKGRAKGQVGSYASPGSGTSARLVTEMLLQRSGIQMLHAPYRSTIPGLQGLAGGEVDLMVTSLASAKALMDSGKIKAIGLTREQRLPGFEGVPTLVESGFPGFVVPVWWGVFAPANLPVDVREKLSALFKQASDTDEYRQQLAVLGLEPRTRTSAEFAAFLRTDTEMWSDVIRKAEIPLED
jgi:tripartite-type tricarboxylate transporter receptor subunit TctC